MQLNFSILVLLFPPPLPKRGTNFIKLAIKHKQNTKIVLLIVKTLEKKMETHSSILAWKIQWTEESGYSPQGHKESDMT